MEALYLNSFRIALPVAFPAARRPTRLPTLPFDPHWTRKHSRFDHLVTDFTG